MLGLGRLAPFDLDIPRPEKAAAPVTVVVDYDEEMAAAKEETTTKKTRPPASQLQKTLGGRRLGTNEFLHRGTFLGPLTFS